MSTIRRLALIATVLIGLCLIIPDAAFADDASCHGSSDLQHTVQTCVRSGTQTNDYISQHSDHVYTIQPACEVGGQALCAEPATCRVDGHDGRLFDVLEDGVMLAWQACLTDQEAVHLGAITPGTIQREFQRLTWPSSPLTIQPPKGRTLVNFDTNFFTTNTVPTTQNVTLLGEQITIEATPVQYVWHFDGTGTPGADTTGTSSTDTTSSTGSDLTTTDPGAAYPDLRVTFRYLRTGTVHPSLDTVYAGRYRLGNGDWHDIPLTLTVTGTPQDLQVVSATPHLVGY